MACLPALAANFGRALIALICVSTCVLAQGEASGGIDLVPSSTPTRAPRISSSPDAKRMELRVSDAARLATTFNSGLKVAYFNHLIERTNIAEAEAAFDPTVDVNFNYGTSEVIFPQIFPTGNINPDGSPEFFQTIVNDRNLNSNWTTGIGGLFPTGATYRVQVQTNYRDREQGGLLNPSYNTSTSVELTQPILRNAFLQYNYANVRLARYSEAQSRQRLRTDLLSTVFSAHQAYWDYVFSLWDLAVKQRSLRVAERLLEINKVKVETGVFAPIEIVAAESGVATRQTEVLVAENAIKDNADTLRRLIMPFKNSSDWDVIIDPVDDVSNERYAIPELDDCIRVALEERPDLSEARIGLRSQDVAVAVADNETMPRLDLVGSASVTGLSEAYGDSITDSFASPGAETWTVGFNLQIPLGNRAARSRLARSRLQRDQALLGYRDLQLTAVEEVRRAHRNVLIAEKTIGARRKEMELKREELKNEQIKLESKVTTNFQVLEVASDLATRESELVRALVDYRVALADLARAMGSSLDVLKWPLKP